jgi:hypothetical protein
MNSPKTQSKGVLSLMAAGMNPVLDNLIRPVGSRLAKPRAHSFISTSSPDLPDKMRAKDLKEFFPERCALRLASARTVEEIFELVMDAVKDQVGVVRFGLDLGLVDLDDVEGRTPVALHPMYCNCIVINRRAVESIKEDAPELLRPLLFHALLYEYLQTIGFVPEPEIKGKVLEISLYLFGKEHPVTRMAEDLSQVLPGMTYAKRMSLPKGIDMVPAEQLALDAL